MMNDLNNRIIWVDLEMTGLDTINDRIIEIAVIITDGDLNVIAEGPNLVVNQPKDVMDFMNDWCIQHHGDSGLTAAVLSSTITTADAESQVLKFIKKYIPTSKVAVLAGNTVWVDRVFLMKEMPRITDWMHYRIIDVSTVRELVKRWNPQALDNAPRKALTHRALDDIRESIQELKFYREHLFKLGGE